MENKSENEFTVSVIQLKYSQSVNNLLTVLSFLFPILLVVVLFIVFGSENALIFFGIEVLFVWCSPWIYRKIVFKFKILGTMRLLEDAIVIELGNAVNRIDLSNINYVELRGKIGFYRSIEGYDAISISIFDIGCNKIVDSIMITTKYNEKSENTWFRGRIFSYLQTKGIRRF